MLRTLFGTLTILLFASSSALADHEGAVYALTNDATHNEVAVFHRSAAGRLTPAGVVSNFADPAIGRPGQIVSGPDGNRNRG